MKFEVEAKHRVEDLATLRETLQHWGVELEAPVEQSDCYFAHPARDFAATDEALRIRSIPGSSFVTYKGPRLEAATKTRRELELPLDASDPQGRQFAQLLDALGFRPVATVRKRRQAFDIRYNDRLIAGALDDVERVGIFAELELLANQEQLDSAQQQIAELASKLQLGPIERRSYLELLLEAPREA